MFFIINVYVIYRFSQMGWYFIGMFSAFSNFNAC